jgi:hypothetical protein
MVDSLSNVSSLQITRALQAFKVAVKESSSLADEQDEDAKVSIDSQTLPLNSKFDTKKAESNSSSLNNKYVNDVRSTAEKYGVNDLSDEDINYAIRYGRSVLVDARG